MKKILLLLVLTGACQAVFAQSQMTIPRILQSQTITNPEDGTIQSINVELNPFDVQSANDSVELLHQRMGTNLSYGSLSGMSDGVTVQSYMTSYGTLNVTGAAALGSSLDVSGTFGVDGDFDVATDKFTVNAVSGNTAVGGTMDVTGAAALGSTLDVSGATGVDGDFDVATDKFTVSAVSGNTAVGGTMDVTGAAALGSTLDVSGATGVDGDFDVATNKFTVSAVSGNTAVGGTMAVTGAAALGSTLDVSGATAVGGTMDVTGATTLGSTLNVSGATTASGTMAVTGATTLSSTLDVSGATGVDGNFDVATNKFTVNAVSGNTAVGGTMDVTGAATLNGQVTINGNAASSYGASDQSPALIIDLAGSAPHRNSNYIQFEAGDIVHGRIEGMNMTQEWASYGTAFLNVLTSTAGALIGPVVNSGMGMIAGATEFNDNNAAYDVYSSGQSPGDALSDLLGVFTTDFGIGLVDGSITLVKDIISAIAEIWGVFYLGAGADDLATTLIDVIDDAASLGLHVYGSYGWTGSGVGNGGVAFESCGADYAEWLQKADPTAIYTPGDVLGVSAGEVGKEIENPERYMVVSTNPTVIGAMPSQEATSAYSRIAFMGQVPTKVLGEVERGDFILPSGNNDGYGVGVHPSEMQTTDYKWIIGTAWSESQPGAMTSVVNVAVGLNENEVTRQVEKIEASVVKIENALARLDPTYTPSVTQSNSTPRIATNTLQSQKVSAIAANMKMQGGDKKKEAQIKAIFNNAQKLAQDAGVDLNSLPYLAEVFEDPLNVSVRENAIARLNERQAQLQFIQKELKRNVKSSEKSEGRDETVKAADPFILLQPQK